MMFYCLGKYSEWQKKIFEEINCIEWNLFEHENLKSFSNLNYFLQEVLRMYTPAPILLYRIAKKTHSIENC
jgi:cytochrome P450